ncbi:hypothetical protein GCM10012279_36870 [Micromonospora yangpuensis]|nr:hypothetical protein GCM10012279_36870 [Micromonospora yangpuensis]
MDVGAVQLRFDDGVLAVVFLGAHVQFVVRHLLGGEPHFRLQAAHLVAAGEQDDAVPSCGGEGLYEFDDCRVGVVLAYPVPVVGAAGAGAQREGAVDVDQDGAGEGAYGCDPRCLVVGLMAVKPSIRARTFGARSTAITRTPSRIAPSRRLPGTSSRGRSCGTGFRKIPVFPAD